jgi:chromosome segregation ATPase
MNKCNKCNVKFRNGTEKVGCGFCSKWYHAEKCAEISKELFEQLCKEKQLHWYCKECNEIAPGVIAIVQKCTKDNVKLQKEVTELKQEVNDVKEELQDIKDGSDDAFVEIVKKLAKYSIVPNYRACTIINFDTLHFQNEYYIL